MTRITIIIDDQDRDQEPEKPWAAYIANVEPESDSIYNNEAGLGVTPEEALSNLAGNESNWSD